jgi:hypothetical protein
MFEKKMSNAEFVPRFSAVVAAFNEGQKLAERPFDKIKIDKLYFALPSGINLHLRAIDPIVTVRISDIMEFWITAPNAPGLDPMVVRINRGMIKQMNAWDFQIKLPEMRTTCDIGFF